MQIQCMHPACCIHRDEGCSSMRKPVNDLYMLNILLGHVHESGKHNVMHDSVDRHGYGGQQKGTIVTLVDRVHQFETY